MRNTWTSIAYKKGGSPAAVRTETLTDRHGSTIGVANYFSRFSRDDGVRLHHQGAQVPGGVSNRYQSFLIFLHFFKYQGIFKTRLHS